jgi:2-hydroxy-3-keto-5-methylthiopentenyl-1-phosphate phosphatase
VRLVLDWDGTVTERDTLHMVIERFGDPRIFAEMEVALGRRAPLAEVIAAEMATIDAPLDEVVAWLVENVRIRPGFADIVAEHSPLVVSAGFHELIEPVLRREGIEVDLVANRLGPRAGGWLARFRPGRTCAVCGEPCKRNAVDGVGPFTYVGDGFSDRCVSQLADRAFARAGLARYLEAEGVPFEPFEDFVGLAAALRS